MVQSLTRIQLLTSLLIHAVFSIEWSENEKGDVDLINLAVVSLCSKWR